MSHSRTINPALPDLSGTPARALAAAVVAASAMAATLGGVPVIVAVALLLCLSAAVLATIARPALVLAAFIVLLPFHLLLMVLFFNGGLDHGLLRVFSVWKELAALIVLSVLATRHLVGGKMPRIRPVDVVVLVFLAWNLLYLVAPIGSPFRPPMAMRVQGLRDNVFFVFLYFIGRLAPMSVRDVRLVLSSALGVGLLGAVVGMAERFLVPIDFFFDPLNLDGFMREYLNLYYYTGLPFNFWTSVGNVRRAVSFHLGSHHFAASFLLVMPLVLGLRRPLRTFPRSLRLPLLCLAAVGLALPLTRSVVLACFLQILLLGVLDKRPHWVLSAGAAVALILGSSLVFLDLGGYFSSVTRVEPGSSVYSHAASWSDTSEIVRNYPMGVGFGVEDTAAERSQGANRAPRTPEGEYAFTMITVGLPGLLLFVALQLSVAVTLLNRYRRATDPAMRNLAMVTLVMVAGYVVTGSFTQVRHVPALMYPLWWLVGTVVAGKLTDEGHRPGAATPSAERRSPRT